MDKLIISGLEVWTRVGCTAEERALPQKLELDLTLELPLKAAGEKDDLSKTVDYADAARRLKKALEVKTYRLAEAVAEEAAVVVRHHFKVKAVTVLVRKRALPGIQWAGVEIKRP